MFTFDPPGNIRKPLLHLKLKLENKKTLMNGEYFDRTH